MRCLGAGAKIIIQTVWQFGIQNQLKITLEVLGGARVSRQTLEVTSMAEGRDSM